MRVIRLFSSRHWHLEKWLFHEVIIYDTYENLLPDRKMYISFFVQITDIINDMEDVFRKKDAEIQQTFDKALLEYKSPVELSGTKGHIGPYSRAINPSSIYV